MAKRQLFLLGPLRKSPILPPGVARAFLKLLGNFFRFEQFLQLSSNSEISEQLVRWPTTCHDKTENLTAKTKYRTTKPKTSRQKQKPQSKTNPGRGAYSLIRA